MDAPLERKIKSVTLCLIHQPPRLLLGLKKRGFGVGKWNGFGGKLAPGETVEEAALREFREEAGIDVLDMEVAGMIDFSFIGDPEILRVHVFRASRFSGEVTESEEMRPAWYHVDELPYGEMWPDDRLWLPLFLAGKKFVGEFVFEGHDKILSYKMTEIKKHEE